MSLLYQMFLRMYRFWVCSAFSGKSWAATSSRHNLKWGAVCFPWKVSACLKTVSALPLSKVLATA
eukprot:9072171-Ditylum_brightwellii.AAC.1